MFRRIVVAVDGSAHARAAALVAAACARELGATLTLLSVYHQPAEFVGEPAYSTTLEDGIREAHGILEAEVNAVEAAGGPTPDKEVLGGDQPAQAILAAAHSGQYDVVVMGNRGHGRLQSALLGSVSAEVASHSPIPVLIVHGTE